MKFNKNNNNNNNKTHQLTCEKNKLQTKSYEIKIVLTHKMDTVNLVS